MVIWRMSVSGRGVKQVPGTIENSKCGTGEKEGDEVQIWQGLVGVVRTLSFTLREMGARTGG